MHFGNNEIPLKLFELARQRLLNQPTSTPEQVRQHILAHGKDELLKASSLPCNHPLIANRVFQAVRLELVNEGKLSQLKRGVWATTKFLRAADAQDPPASAD